MDGNSHRRARQPRVVVADPDAIARAEISRTLLGGRYDPLELETGDEVLETVRREQPRAAIIEVDLPRICGYEVCRRLRERGGDDIAIILISGSRTESFDRVAGILLGADDYLSKPIAGDELLARVGRLISRRTAPGSVSGRLTMREREVLDLLEDGLRHREIAERLSISPKTVGTHVEHIFSKLGATHRQQAIALARGSELAVASG